MGVMELKESPSKADAEAWVVEAVRAFGGGFHPDTPGREYVVVGGERDGQRMFSDVEADALDRSLERAFGVLGDGVYEVGLGVMREGVEDE